jgi:hypothetical protein
MLGNALVVADGVGCSGLGRDLDAEDLQLDSNVDANNEIVGDEASKESGGGASYEEVEDKDSDKLEEDE